MTKKFGPECDALNLEIGEVVDEIISLLEKRRSGTANTASQKLKSTKLSLGQGRSSATWQVSSRAQSFGLKPLHDRELKSVHALLVWVANEQGAAPETVQAITETHFGVPDVKKLRQKDYDEVIKFLVDLRIDELRH
jgi:hypothetical protein